MVTLNFTGVEEPLLKGLAAFAEHYGFSLGQGGLDITVKKSDGFFLSVSRQKTRRFLKSQSPFIFSVLQGFCLKTFPMRTTQ